MRIKWLILLLSFLLAQTKIIEHSTTIQIPPNDKVHIYLQITTTNTNTLLIWLGHTPAHSINYKTNNTAIPHLSKELNIFMFDLPGTGKTISNQSISLAGLSLYGQLVFICVKDVFSNYSFNELWIGGEKLMVPLVLALADRLTEAKSKVVGLILGNPYLSPEISLVKRTELLSQLGSLDIDKKEQYDFLNDMCKVDLWNCQRADRLLQLTTNTTREHNNWTMTYIKSIVSSKDYMNLFVSLLKSKKHKILIYTGQLDYSSSFERIYSMLKHFGVYDVSEAFNYYRYKKSITGYYKQNEYWSLLQLYNSSSNITSLHGELMGEVFEEFIKNGKLSCKGEQCSIKEKIKEVFPNCYIDDWISERYNCVCVNGKYGATCSIDVEDVDQMNVYKGLFHEGEVKYLKYVIMEEGYLELVSSRKDCNIDMYSNLYPINVSQLDIPTNKHYDIHTNKNKLYASKQIIMLKLKNTCNTSIELEIAYIKQEEHNVLAYLILGCILILAILIFGIFMTVIQFKMKKRYSPVQDNN